MRGKFIRKSIAGIALLAATLICGFQVKIEAKAVSDGPVIEEVSEQPDNPDFEIPDSIVPYIEEDPGYEVHTMYLHYESAVTGDFYNIYYPELVSTNNINTSSLAKINESIKNAVTERMNMMYPDFLYNYDTSEYKLCETYFYVTYVSKDLFSFVFEERFCLGSEFREFVHYRSGIYDINNSTKYELKDSIINHDAEFDREFYELLVKHNEHMTDHSVLNEDMCSQMFDGEYVNNCYFVNLFLTDGGIQMGVNIHYIDSQWMIKDHFFVTFDENDLQTMCNRCPMWKYFLSTGKGAQLNVSIPVGNIEVPEGAKLAEKIPGGSPRAKKYIKS